jgi:hypothetical protein
MIGEHQLLKQKAVAFNAMACGYIDVLSAVDACGPLCTIAAEHYTRQGAYDELCRDVDLAAHDFVAVTVQLGPLYLPNSAAVNHQIAVLTTRAGDLLARAQMARIK